MACAARTLSQLWTGVTPRVAGRCLSSSCRDVRQCSTNAPYFVTTPIFYVNGRPHIGHLYSALLADALQRWSRVADSSRPVIFSTGTDEHGLKVKKAAEAQGRPPQAFSDEVSDSFKKLFDKASIGYTDFVRTSEPRHHRAVQTLWERLEDVGAIYKGSYDGWYSISDEAFLSESQVVDVAGSDGGNSSPSKVCADTGNAVIWMSEENYMFRLSDYAQPLLKWLDENPDAILPKFRAAEVRTMINAGLPDLSISRSAEKLDWGIPVPNDKSHTVYVWMDALTNYLTVAGYPDKMIREGGSGPDVQVVGKDILKFHAIYWPAFLLAAGLPLPRTIVAHAHWTLDGKKIAKSKGNTVDPVAKLDQYGTDQLRFFLLREGRIRDDADFTESKVVASVNELANKLGNLFSRSTSKKINPAGIIPAVDTVNYAHGAEAELVARVEATAAQVPAMYEAANFSEGIDDVMMMLKAANIYFDSATPWKLARMPDDLEAQTKLRTVIYMSLECLRVAAVLLQPVIPGLACQLLDRMGLEKGDIHRGASTLRFGVLDGQTLLKNTLPLVQKIDPQKNPHR